MADQAAICCRSADKTAFEFTADAAYLTTLPEEVAKGIMFVVQNDFVTGTTVDVDGGWLLS